MDTTVEAAGFILMTRREPRKFLLLKHHNRWDLPKGHAEEGESILQAALRETEEESGVPQQSIDVEANFSFVVEYEVRGTRRGDYLKRVTYFLGWLDNTPEITLTEHIDFAWFDWPTNGSIQARTIDPLLKAVALHLETRSAS